LECVTRSVNTLHAHHQLGKVFGLFGRDNHGTNNGRAVLDWDTVREIRRLHASGHFTQAALAARFGVGRTQISNIVNNLQWQE
jgi:hypothetical protein